VTTPGATFVTGTFRVTTPGATFVTGTFRVTTPGATFVTGTFHMTTPGATFVTGTFRMVGRFWDSRCVSDYVFTIAGAKAAASLLMGHAPLGGP